MSNLAVESLGYAAAVVTNISVYPQAYEVWLVVENGDSEKLASLSLTMFVLQGTGCAMWLVFGLMRGIWPVVAGSTMTILPSAYIIFSVWNNRPRVQEHPVPPPPDTSEIIVATGTNYICDSYSSGFSSPKE
jgi:MtN3 and saliva related transmembrane protein